jgi:anti-sigma-K factor RskA
MSTATHYEASDLALFALQILEESEHRSMSTHVNSCAFCLQELGRLQGDLAACAYAVEMQIPGDSVRERILHQVAREKKIIPMEPGGRALPVELAEPSLLLEEPTLEWRTRGQRPAAKAYGGQEDMEDEDRPAGWSNLRRNLSLWLSWAAVAGLAVAGTMLYQQREDYRARLAKLSEGTKQLKENTVASKRAPDLLTDESAEQIVLSGASQGTGGAAPQGVVLYSAEGGTLLFLGDHLADLDPGKTYELWLIPADGRDPIPAGTFVPDARGDARITLPPLPKAVRAKAFGVTIEEGEGAQSPTMPIVMAGE